MTLIATVTLVLGKHGLLGNPILIVVGGLVVKVTLELARVVCHLALLIMKLLGLFELRIDSIQVLILESHIVNAVLGFLCALSVVLAGRV